MTGQGYHRRKRPEAVREAILREAAAFAVERGIQSLTLQAVADRAGVTKGGLMHHFADKPALLSALRNRALEHFAAALERNLEEGNLEDDPDPDAEGRFTRAYVRTCLASARQEAELSLITALWADPELRAAWYAWLADQEALHAATDGGVARKLVRLAADGAWLAAMDGADTAEWEEGLLRIAGAGAGLAAW